MFWAIAIDSDVVEILIIKIDEIIYEIERFDKRFYELRIYNDITKKH